MRFLIALAALCAGCFEPGLANGGFVCGDGNACPANFTCAADARCYRLGELPDLAGFEQDMGPCQPMTCAELGKNCGAVSNGCDATMSCGSCDAPNACGGGGP